MYLGLSDVDDSFCVMFITRIIAEELYLSIHRSFLLIYGDKDTKKIGKIAILENKSDKPQRKFTAFPHAQR
jgi:hypothetical protein